MQLQKLFAPISGAVASAAARRTVLPFAIGPAAPVGRAPDPTAVMNAFRRLQESSIEPPVLFAAPQLAPQRRQPSARLKALRRNGIVETADQGAALLRQVRQGALTANDAAASFATTLRASPFSTKATGQLQTDFTTGLQQVQNQRQTSRPLISSRPNPATAHAQPLKSHLVGAETRRTAPDGGETTDPSFPDFAFEVTPQGASVAQAGAASPERPAFGQRTGLSVRPLDMADSFVELSHGLERQGNLLSRFSDSLSFKQRGPASVRERENVDG